ncbi:MAG: hypothetical protein ABS939_00570 [Psychrobacillus sp.]
MSIKLKTIQWTIITTLLLALLMAFSISSKAEVTPKNNAAWSNINIEMKETVTEEGQIKEFTWDYIRNSDGHWKKTLIDAKGPNVEGNIGYTLQFNGKEIREYIPKIDTVLISAVNVGEQHEADFFIQPQRVEHVKELSKNTTNMKSEVLNNQNVNVVSLGNNELKERYWLNKDFILKAEIDGGSSDMKRTFEITGITKMENEKLNNILTKDLVAGKTEYLEKE